MNILFIAPGLNSNRGGERVILKYATELANRGENVFILIPNGTKTIKNTNKNVNIIEYKSFLPPFWSRQLGYVDAILPAIKKIPKDIDIIIGTYIPQLIVPIIYKFLNKKVKFIIFNQDFSAMFENRPERQIMFKLYPKFASDIISISDFCANEIYNSSKQKSTVISNGLESEFFSDSYKKEKENYILWIGSKNKHKGFKYFLNAIYRVREKYPNIKIITAEGALKVLDNSEIIKVNGDLELLKKLYSNAKVFVCSSLSEGFGLPALEAMACGCPVVTTDTGGCREYAANNYNSLIVPIKDSKALADAIIEILSNEELAERLAKNGFESAQNFRWEKAIDKIYKFLKDKTIE